MTVPGPYHTCGRRTVHVQIRATVIYLIRHGETASNARRIVQHTDTPLNARGALQAERLATRLADAGLTRIIASDYPRARQTAAALAQGGTVPLELTPLLRERDLGRLRGRPYAEVESLFYSPDDDPPGGETWVRFLARVSAAWARIRRAAGAGGSSAGVAVVTHGLVCRALAEHHVGLEPGASAPTWFPNASVTLIDAAPPWTLRLSACVTHLDGL